MNPTRVAIVTGASRGIGAAVAKRLAADGLAVVVNYAGSAKEAQGVVDAIEAAGGNAIAAQADVSDPAAVKTLFDAAEAAFGRIDVLVNNAGIMPPDSPPLASTSDAVFDRIFAVNVKGTFNALLRSWPYLALLPPALRYRAFAAFTNAIDERNSSSSLV